MGEIGGRSVASLGGRRAIGDIHGQRQDFDLKLPGRWGGVVCRGLPATHDRLLAYHIFGLAASGDRRPTPERRSLPKGQHHYLFGIRRLIRIPW